MEALYLTNSYLKEFDAGVVSVEDDKYVVLDRTAFYPNAGGQLYDTGKIIKGNQEFNVIFVGKFNDEISHEVDKPGLNSGDKVKCYTDWDRRYKLMRMHTAAHIISGVFHKEAGALITGNQLGLDQTRIDFSLENFDRDKINYYFNRTNELINKDLPIKVYTLPREEAEKDETMFKLAKELPSYIKDIRVVEIVGFDRQADGGTHVKSLKEVGKIEFIKAENKGKDNRRVYFKLNLV